MKITTEDLGWAPLADQADAPLYGRIAVPGFELTARISPHAHLWRWTVAQIGDGNVSYDEIGAGSEGTISDAQAAVVRTINDRLDVLHPEDDDR